MHPSTAVDESIPRFLAILSVSGWLLSVVAMIASVVAWSSARPGVVHSLKQRADEIEGELATFLQSMSTLRDASEADLVEAKRQRHRASNTVARIPHDGVPGGQVVFDDSEQGMANVRAHWEAKA